MKNKKIVVKKSTALKTIFRKVAPKIGAHVLLEPEWEVAGQITFKHGHRSYFKFNAINLNPLGSSKISEDKDFAHFFMHSMGYPIIPKSKTFFSNEWAEALGSPTRNLDAAYAYAQKLGFPLIVKPNSGSQGLGVALVHSKREFYRAMKVIFKQDKVAIVQPQVLGKDYRLVVLDKKLISAYERIPLNVIGDGKSTIYQLLRKKQQQFNTIGRDTQINLEDPRIKEKIKHQQLSLHSILGPGKKIFLLDNANLSTGGDSVDVTKKVHTGFKRMAIQLTRDMGLRLCGIDLVMQGDIQQKPSVYWILEINAAPGLDHYAKSGKAQQKIVENLYLQVLKSLDRG